MKSVLVATSLMTALALSKPLEKRYYVTETDTLTFTVTETGSAAEATGWGHWGGNWGGWASSADPVVPSTTTAAAAPDWTPAAYSTSEAPATTPAPATTAPAAAAWSSAAPAASAWSSAAPAPSSGSVSGYAQAILDQHNNHRANHSAPALVWDDNMASIAQTIGASCVYAHDTATGGGGYGQNIGAGASPDAVPALITNEMYNDEIGFFPLPYGQSQPDMSQFENWGHFSQIVWQSTTSVGCATVDCSGGGLANTGSGVSPWFTVCNYSPPGNFQGEYGSNIAEPAGDSVVVVPS